MTTLCLDDYGTVIPMPPSPRACGITAVIRMRTAQHGVPAHVTEAIIRRALHAHRHCHRSAARVIADAFDECRTWTRELRS